MRNLTATICLTIAVLLGSAGVSESLFAATDYPTSGIVYGETEKSALTYHCKITQDPNQIECDFVATNVRPKSSPEKWLKRKNKNISMFKKMTKIEKQKQQKSLCELGKQITGVFTGKIRPPNMGNFEKMSAAEKSSLKKMSSLANQTCQGLSQELFTKFERFAFEKDLKTCSISSSSFSQILRRQFDASKNIWVIKDKVSGPCGIVRLDRFEIANTKFGLWNYYSRKAVTNPSGSNGFFSCSKLDEEEYKYQWQSKELYLSCEIIEFGLF